MTALIPQIAKPLRNDVIIPKNRRRVKIKRDFFSPPVKPAHRRQTAQNNRAKTAAVKRSWAIAGYRRKAINEVRLPQCSGSGHIQSITAKPSGRQAPAVGFAVRFSNVLPRLSARLMNKRRDLPFSAASKLKFSDGLREAGGGKRMAGCYSKHLVKQKFTKEC